MVEFLKEFGRKISIVPGEEREGMSLATFHHIAALQCHFATQQLRHPKKATRTTIPETLF